MQLDLWLASCAALAFVTLLVSGMLRRMPLSGPLVALVAGVLLGPEVGEVLEAHHNTLLLHRGSELLLAISLMAVALRYPVRDLTSVIRPAALLVTVGMLAMACVTALLALRVLGLPLPAALLLGAVLAPTDPVLASSVITGEPAERDLPVRLRHLLSTESGANDGLAWPMVIIALALVLGESVGASVVEAAVGVLVAVAVGAGLGAGAGQLLRLAQDRREIETSALFVASLALAVLVLATVNLMGGDGVLAVFVAGLTYNMTAGPDVFQEEGAVEEGVHRVLVLPLFVLLGVSLPWTEWASLSLATLGGFVLLVLVLRRPPMVLLLRRWLHLDMPGAAFLGWFGPMGVAALFYLSLARERGAIGETVWAAGMLTIVASTVVHGVSAMPGRREYVRWKQRRAASR